MGRFFLPREQRTAKNKALSMHLLCKRDRCGRRLTSRWPSVDIIAPLETDTGMAVVAAPAAMVWGALKALKIMDCRPGYGRLMESLRLSNGHNVARGL